MGHKCFISFKTEDLAFKKAIQQNPKIDMVDKSLNEPIDSNNEGYIIRKIREEYLKDSTVTIHLIGNRSAENLGWTEQRYIKRELQASLYNGEGNSRNGLLGVILPQMMSTVYKGSYYCTTCSRVHNYVGINDETVIKEFRVNYYIPRKGKCSWSEDDRYAIIIGWDDFIKKPNKYIDQAFDKRSNIIAKDVKVYPK